ncbi:MAG: S8 family serine peptidase [Deltaproteobacteria bacterium]|nr:S8 family serine peptidase [Deltaproteobacteria bacterium]
MSRVAALLVAAAGTANAAPTWLWNDDGNRVTATPADGSAVSTARGEVFPVNVQYPDGRATRAHVGLDLVVRVPRGADPKTALAAAGLQPQRPLMPAAGLWLARDAAGRHALDAVTALQARPKGTPLDAWPDLWLRRRSHAITLPPDDPLYSGQWYLTQIHIADAWALSTGNAATTVVVIDNGCDLTHPDLLDKLDEGRDVVSGDNDPSYDPNGQGNNHGTSCAGIVGATTGNALGMAGACPECRLRCVRLLDDSATGTPLSADVDAFQFVIDSGAAVASNSWGFVDAIPVPAGLKAAIETTFDTGRGGKGALVLFASGNDDREVGADELLAVRGVIGVGAVNLYEETTSFTNYGAPVDLVAPTGTVTTDIHGTAGEETGDYTNRFGGTSSACPVAAGAAALLAAAAPDKTAAELTDILLQTTRPSPYANPGADGHDPYYGYGVIDPAHALRVALGLPDPVDGGVPADAGMPDAGTVDAGTGSGGDAPPPPDDGKKGCLCAAPTAGGPTALLGGLLAAWRWRRRPRH